MVTEVNNSSPAVMAALEQRGMKLDKTANGSMPVEVPSTGATGDSVKLTELAARLRDLGNSVENQPVVDRQRVEQLKKAVNEGSYKVDSQAVASKLASFEALLAPAPEGAA